MLCGTMAGEKKVEGLTSVAPAVLRHRGRWGAVAAWRSSGVGNGGSGAWDAMAQEDICRWRTASSGRWWKWQSAGLRHGPTMDELEQSDGPASGAATKHRKKVRLVASSRSGEWEKERMGARLGVWKMKKGAWQTARCVAGGGGRARVVGSGH
jgi:hypothetical protein